MFYALWRLVAGVRARLRVVLAIFVMGVVVLSGDSMRVNLYY